MTVTDMYCSKRVSRSAWPRAVGPLAAIACWMVLAGPASAQSASGDCGSLANAFGPFDYTDASNRTQQPGGAESPLSLVERAHFTSEVERLISGVSSVSPIDDLVYTLRAFPNHHRALHALATYQVRHQPRKLGPYSIDCWFDRAIRFRPNDPTVRVVYGIYLARVDRNQDALTEYKTALENNPNLPEAHYNLGLLYTDLKEYDLALEHALEAYEAGYPLPGLRRRLVRAGAWQSDEED